MKTKHLFIALAAAMMLLGTAMPAQAQKKVTKRTTTTKKKKPATQLKNIVTADFPTTVDGHLAFCGISMAESPATMKAKLIELGMKVVIIDPTDNNNIYLEGMLDGKKVLTNIAIGAEDKIYHIWVDDKNPPRLKQAQSRFKSLVEEKEKIYGKGTYKIERNEADNKQYTFKIGAEEMSICLFNQDEMDGQSLFYTIRVAYFMN